MIDKEKVITKICDAGIVAVIDTEYHACLGL